MMLGEGNIYRGKKGQIPLILRKTEERKRKRAQAVKSQLLVLSWSTGTGGGRGLKIPTT